ncbi:hypothetical protein GALMADRAFT_245743 [Galerina marginata CBS 339.88]|uniref:intramembrane prenyl-peptidase Rce1 n=1 Tax=Galerina marginata (strain CBS 339.88) TaxID=685588 RepID=A0A067T338_GALM3|nr:hypothetical protein GALMADRAFT_245743 [Galerina marginata CBS 339.88]
MQLLFSEPLLSTSSAHLMSLGLAVIYVGSLYLSKNARLSFAKAPRSAKGDGSEPRGKEKNERWRDDPDVIRARLVAVSVATLVCCLCVFGVLWAHVGGTLRNLDLAADATLLRLGLPLSFEFRFKDVYPHLVTPILFIGPLFGGYLGKELPGQRNWLWESHMKARFLSIQGVRNYCVAPLTEEIVFRGCVLAIYHLSGASRTRMIFLAPLTFGMAHIHHAWDTYNTHGRHYAALKRAIITSCFQLGYTTLFGFHVSYLFLRTGSIFPPITAHIVCNIMGIPEIGYELRKFQRYRHAIISIYLIGIVGFVYTLTRWTRTDDNFYWAVEGDERYKLGRY